MPYLPWQIHITLLRFENQYNELWGVLLQLIARRDTIDLLIIVKLYNSKLEDVLPTRQVMASTPMDVYVWLHFLGNSVHLSSPL